MSVNSKMTAIADQIRTLQGGTGKLGLDAMATQVGAANSTVTAQASLISQIASALEGKAGGRGSKVASGTLSQSKYYSESDNRYHYGGALTGLDFVPKVIIWSSSNQVLVSSRADYTYTCITNPNTGAPQYILYGNSSDAYKRAVNAMGDAYAENGTYFLTVENSTSSYTPSGSVYWYAIG